jgi:hypothetical protein
MEKEKKKEMDVKKLKAKAVQNKLIFMVQHLCYLPTGVNAPDEITLLQLHNTFIEPEHSKTNSHEPATGLLACYLLPTYFV